MHERIEKHGRQLLEIFPDADEQDPVKLCKKLRRIEARVDRAACGYANGTTSEAQFEAVADAVYIQLRNLLRSDRVWINSDPRGYALKVNLADGEELHRDWGGYGIIAPDLS